MPGDGAGGIPPERVRLRRGAAGDVEQGRRGERSVREEGVVLDVAGGVVVHHTLPAGARGRRQPPPTHGALVQPVRHSDGVVVRVHAGHLVRRGADHGPGVCIHGRPLPLRRLRCRGSREPRLPGLGDPDAARADPDPRRAHAARRRARARAAAAAAVGPHGRVDQERAAGGGGICNAARERQRHGQHQHGRKR